jgi:hypothetical protein
MANEEHLAILRQGVEVWNAWREANPDIKPNLSGAGLSHAKLSEVNLSGGNRHVANLREVDLRGADLRGAHLREVDLRYANLGRVNLSQADMRQAKLNRVKLNGATLSEAHLSGAVAIGADLTEAILDRATLMGTDLSRGLLRGADLSGAVLSQADLTKADLNGANLSGAKINDTIFADLDLSHVRGLDTISHDGPSTIGIDTLVHSKGKLPEIFLRGCGVPESFIEYLPALLGAMEPIQFYSCFISYSTRDEEFAKRLHSRMRDNNLRVWFANEDLKGGHKLHEQIDEAIRVYDKLIIVLSPDSLRSKWVMNEVRRTRKAELANNQRKFFPIGLIDYQELEGWECIDPETGTDLAAEIREYYIPDFRDWKNHDSFEKAFAQLLEGLKAVDAPPVPRAAMPAAMSSISYARGLERLREVVSGHEAQAEFATLEARLLGMLQEERLHGSSENTRAGKSQVIHALNQLVSGNSLGDSFTDLCRT